MRRRPEFFTPTYCSTMQHNTKHYIQYGLKRERGKERTTERDREKEGERERESISPHID